LQRNGVADKLTHLTYAFGGTTPTGCAIADSWADYQSPYLPSVSGDPIRWTALRQLCRARAVEAASSQSEGADLACRAR
jgi:hypothetical protein